MSLDSGSKRTKIVCTLGPSTDQPAILAKMLRAGMDVARLNFSHGAHFEHASRIKILRQIAQKQGRIVATLQDLPGPKLRLGKIAEGQLALEKGQRITLSNRPPFGKQRLPLESNLLSGVVRPKENLYLADGTIRLAVLSVKGKDILTEVQNDGIIRSGSGLNLPDTNLFGPGFYQSDRKHLLFGLKNRVDWIGVSFVGSGENLRTVRNLCQRYRHPVKLMAKIERQLALQNLDEIIAEADGVMVARGDLGIEIPISQVPLVQKEIIARCNQAGKPVIVATQMLESMVNSPRPTRAEVTDVANAVLDGADAVMLSEETALGKFPVQAVEMLSQVSQATERVFPYDSYLARAWPKAELETSFAIGYAVADTAGSLGLETVVAFTESGSTARLVSRFRPNCRIVAFTPSESNFRRLAAVWGVTPLLFPRYASTDEMISHAEKVLLQRGMVTAGEWVAMVAGIPPNQQSSTNLLKLHVV